MITIPGEVKPIMKCGHAASSYIVNPDGTTSPCCCSCFGIRKEAEEVWLTDRTILSNRTAKCGSCKSTKSSDTSLAFFEYRPNETQDSFYCGCRGWD